MAGGAFGSIINLIVPSIAAPPGAYALVGMAAVTSSTLQAPLSASILVFEMTDKYEVILPLLLAVVAATFISKKYMRGSIYTIRLQMMGENLDPYGRDINILKSIKVRDVMKTHVTAVSESTRLSDLIEMISESDSNVFPVIRYDGTLAGTVSFGEIRQTLELKDVQELANVLVVKDILNPGGVSVNQNDDMSVALKKISDAGIRSVPVIRDNRQIAGMLYLHDALQAYEKELLLREVKK
jgi:Chloride channel protein EriC